MKPKKTWKQSDVKHLEQSMKKLLILTWKKSTGV